MAVFPLLFKLDFQNARSYMCLNVSVTFDWLTNLIYMTDTVMNLVESSSTYKLSSLLEQSERQSVLTKQNSHEYQTIVNWGKKPLQVK